MDERIREILETVADGVTCYEGDDDEIGVCAFCGVLSYRDHRDRCEVLLAKEILKEMK